MNETLYVAMVIGCLECSNDSRCLGVFDSRLAARAAISAAGMDEDFAEADDSAWGSEQARIFEVAGVGQPSEPQGRPEWMR